MIRNSRPVLSHALVTATAALTSGVGFLATATIASGAQGVLVTGTQTDYGETMNQGAGAYTLDDLCAASPTVGMAMRDIVNHVDRAMVDAGSPLTIARIESMPDAPNRYDIERDMAVARDEICNRPEPPTTIQPFVITYTACRMAMYTETHAMVMNMPSDSNSAYMLMADHTTRDVVHINLTRELDEVTQYVGEGWSDMIDMRAAGQSGEHIGYDTDYYTFEYTSGLGEAGLGALTQGDVEAGAITSQQALGNLVSVTVNGSAWVSDSVPGIDIVRSFYENLTSRAQADQETSFFGGLIKNTVGMLSHGMPLEIEQTSSSKVMGRTMVGGRSRSIVTGIRLTETPGSCGEIPVPEGYTVTDVNEQMSQAMAGGDGPSSDEMAEAMEQYNQAMQSMTPEQQQMMEQLGMGNMTGGANPAAQSAGATAAASGAGASMPSAEELHSDNLTQMVQNHLKALGYDTGNTDGDASLETTIAISQFQAEKGLAVTGEVSPQLAGMLSAEVDSRRGN